jgi:hypothetical protein
MKENRGEITMKEDKRRLCARVVLPVSRGSQAAAAQRPGRSRHRDEARRYVHNRYCPIK